jgi:hypothetical protein
VQGVKDLAGFWLSGKELVECHDVPTISPTGS